MKKFFEKFISLSDEEKELFSKIDTIKKEYPSFNVTDKGAFFIDPREIRASKSFQSDLNQVEELNLCR